MIPVMLIMAAFASILFGYILYSQFRESKNTKYRRRAVIDAITNILIVWGLAVISITFYNLIASQL